MKIKIIIPTFEPDFISNSQTRELEDFYAKNIKSWLAVNKEDEKIEVSIIISDFSSSENFRDFLSQLAEPFSAISLLFGDEKLWSVEAFNRGLQADRSADIFVYAASDTAAKSRNWASLVKQEIWENPNASIIFSTCAIGGSQAVDQVQANIIDKCAKKLALHEEPIPNVVFFKRNLMEAYNFSVGDALFVDLAYSFTWMAQSIDSDRVLSYRLFVEHDHFIQKGRFARVNTTKTRHKADREVRRKISNHLHFRERRLPAPWPIFSIANIWAKSITPVNKKSKYPFLLIVIRRLLKQTFAAFLRFTGLPHICTQIYKFGIVDYIFQNHSHERKLAAFLSMTPKERVKLVKRLFYKTVP